MNPTNPVEIKKDNNEVVSTNADKNAEAKVLASSLHDEKNIETDVAVNKEKGKVSLLAVNSLNTSITNKDAVNFEKSIDKNDDKKSLTEKAGNRVKEHKKVLGRGVGIGAGLLLFRFFRKKKKEKSGEGSHENQKKPFRETGRGKALKYTMIGGGIYYGVHGLSTGRWAMKDLLNWSERNKINPEDLKSRYEKLPAELKPKYEDFGNMVDTYRSGLGNTDSLGKLENDKNESIIIPKGAIPAAMDDAYSSVGDILDTENYIDDKRRDIGGKLRDKVTGLGSKVAGTLFRPFVGIIKGLSASMFGTNNEPNEEFKKWAQQEDLSRDEQVANLMSKYSMVRVYLGDKKKQLEYAYATDYLRAQGNANPSKEQVMDALDDNAVKDYVDSKVSHEFMKKKIASLNDANGVVAVLKKSGVYNDVVSEDTHALIDNIQERKNEVITDKTIFEKAKNSLDINKDATLKKELMGVSDKFSAYLKKGLLQRNMFESMANCFGILNIDQLRNGKQDDIEEVMESLGFNDAIKRFAVANTDFKTKLVDGTLTKDDVTNFEKNINDYFNKEQEILLEAQRKNDDESMSWSNVWSWGKGRLYKLVSTPEGWVIIGSVYAYSKFGVVRTTVNSLGKPIKWSLKQVAGLAVNPLIRRMNTPVLNTWMKLKIYSTDVKSYNLLMNDVVTGKIDAATAEKVFDYRAKAWGTEVGEFNQKLASKLNITDDQAKLLKKYFNGDIRKLAKDGKMNFGKLCVKLKDFQDKLLLVGAEKEALMINLINNGRMKNLDAIDHIIKNIDNINLTGLSPEQIKTLTKELSKDVSLVNDVNKIDALIKNIKAGVNTTMSAAELAKLHGKIKVGSRVISKTGATGVILEMKGTGAIVQYGNATAYTELTNLNAQEHLWRETEGALKDKSAKELFSRTSQDVDVMVRELTSLGAKDKSAKALVKQIESLKDFAQNIKNLSPQEITKITEVIEHISMKSIAILSHNVKDFEGVLKQAASGKTFSALELKGMLTSQVDDKIVEALVKDINAFGSKVNKIAKINESIMKFAEVLAKFIRK